MDEIKKWLTKLAENSTQEGIATMHPAFSAARIASSFYDPRKERKEYIELYNFVENLILDKTEKICKD